MTPLRASLLACLLCALAAPAPARALPAAPFPIELRNADGTTVVGRLRGDEHLSWAEDLEGFPLAYDGLVGAWHYATLGADGRLAPLPWRAGEVDPRRLGVAPHLAPTDQAMRSALARRGEVRTRPAGIAPKGTIKNLVFLVKFNCASGCDAVNRTVTYQPSSFQAVFNGATNSVAEYYKEISYGAFTLQSDIAANAWIPLPQNDAYYVYNDAVPNGHPEQMIKDAVAWLDAQTPGGFDFSPYDLDHDNAIDAVDVIHIGPGYEFTGNSKTIHSHYMNLGEYNMAFQSQRGTWFTGYHTEPEVRYGGGITQIGAICHETAHFFGAPDLYDYNQVSQGLGMWSLMAGGSWGGPGTSWGYGDGTRPTHPDAYTRMVLGFVTAKAVTGGSQTLRPVETSPDVALVGEGMPGAEFFLLEVRQKLGYDLYIPGTGLAIYHVDEGMKDLGYDPQAQKLVGWNLDANHYLVDLEQADGKRQLNKSMSSGGNDGDAADLYTASRSFGPGTSPSSKPYDAAAPARLTIASIAAAGTSYSFSVTVGSSQVANGQPCTADSGCVSGHCADSVCCDTACNAGGCDACSVAAGAGTNGVCALLSARACNDADPCTLNDTCQAGVCRGTPKTCGTGGMCTLDQVCNKANGACESAGAKPDGTACNDGNACTRNDFCKAGLCTGTNPLPCNLAPDPCHEAPGACNWQTGACDFKAAANGSACDDGDPATADDACQNGRCAGTPVAAAECDGQPDGTACATGACKGGQCVAPEPKQTGCGCASSSGAPGLFALLLGSASILRPRRRAGTPPPHLRERSS